MLIAVIKLLLKGFFFLKIKTIAGYGISATSNAKCRQHKILTAKVEKKAVLF